MEIAQIFQLLAQFVEIRRPAGEAIACRSGKGRLVAVCEEGLGECASRRLQQGNHLPGGWGIPREQIGMLANDAARFGETDHLG